MTAQEKLDELQGERASIDAVMKTVKILEQRSNGYLVEGPINGENVISSGPENLKDGESVRIKGQSS